VISAAAGLAHRAFRQGAYSRRIDGIEVSAVGREERRRRADSLARTSARRRHASDECIGKNEMKISARNFLEGKIKEVHKGATTAHVEIELKGGETVISSITNEAVEELGLKKGTQAYAVIKASDVMIAIK
jgi:molybdopterin-binding protein